MGRLCSTYGERRGAYWGFGEETGYHLKYPGVDGGIILKMDLREVRWEAWTGSVWLRTGTGGGLL
jgi:hypothetical protein